MNNNLTAALDRVYSCVEHQLTLVKKVLRCVPDCAIFILDDDHNIVVCGGGLIESPEELEGTPVASFLRNTDYDITYVPIDGTMTVIAEDGSKRSSRQSK